MSHLSPTIRRYRPDDLESVMAIWRRANALAHPFLNQDYVSQAEREVRETYIPNAETYVTEADGEVVGFIALCGSEIGGLFLEPCKRGAGYGKSMVEHSIAIKGSLKVDVFEENKIGLRFYRRRGFDAIARELHAPSGHMICKMSMPDP